MRSATNSVQIATLVPADLAEQLRELARQSERSASAELRLAVRAWIAAAGEVEQAAA